jgi:nicotinamidase/pyrazinamidase
MKKALILVDLQNDFMPGGALPVPDGDEVISVANMLQPHFDLIVATKDWHPANHGSFVTQHKGHKVGDIIDLIGIPQILWPVHCVQHSKGAEFVAELNTKRIGKIFHKGTDALIDSYSTFFDNAHRRSTGLADYLKQERVHEVYLMGVATDYCVKYSVLDACILGLKTYVIEDGCRGINLQPHDCEQSFAEMIKVGAKIVTSKELIST